MLRLPSSLDSVTGIRTWQLRCRMCCVERWIGGVAMSCLFCRARNGDDNEDEMALFLLYKYEVCIYCCFNKFRQEPNQSCV